MIGGDLVGNMKLLKEKMNDSGLTITLIAKRSGILRETLYNRLNGIGEFKASEITSLTKVLKLSKKDREQIFFANNSELNSTKTK